MSRAHMNQGVARRSGLAVAPCRNALEGSTTGTAADARRSPCGQLASAGCPYGPSRCPDAGLRCEQCRRQLQLGVMSIHCTFRFLVWTQHVRGEGPVSKAAASPGTGCGGSGARKVATVSTSLRGTGRDSGRGCWPCLAHAVACWGQAGTLLGPACVDCGIFSCLWAPPARRSARRPYGTAPVAALCITCCDTTRKLEGSGVSPFCVACMSATCLCLGSRERRIGRGCVLSYCAV